ncbi:MAG: NAD-dependent epimerase/dehydratase family protein [Anaerolineae bacterium]
MRLLILGGTVFLGRALVDAALARGHAVTLFNRGQHNPELYPDIEKLRGDRDGGLAALAGREWDAVIDTCGYVPRIVGAAAEALADHVGRYVFISTISVYADFSGDGPREESPVGVLADATVEEINGETYGPLKALCEQAVEAALPGRALIIRPGLIVGPHDVSDRFTYWPRRIAQGGDVLAPAVPAMPVQIIDVRDLAEWTIRMVEENRSGVYNATGPQDPLTFADVLDECRAVTGGDARVVWVDAGFLLEQDVGPWVEMPLWLTPDSWALARTSIRRALDAGLTFRPLTAIIQDTLVWDAARPPETQRRAGMARERERALLDAWRQKASDGAG